MRQKDKSLLYYYRKYYGKENWCQDILQRVTDPEQQLQECKQYRNQLKEKRCTKTEMDKVWVDRVKYYRKKYGDKPAYNKILRNMFLTNQERYQKMKALRELEKNQD